MFYKETLRKMRNSISKRLVKRILKDNWDGEISNKVVNDVRKRADEYLRYISADLVNNVKEENTYRQIQKLPDIRRITLTIYKKLSGNLYIQPNDVNTCGLGYSYKKKPLIHEEAIEVT